MAYQFQPGQKVQFVGRGTQNFKVHPGDVGTFISYEPEVAPLEKLMIAVLRTKGHITVGAEFNGCKILCLVHELRPIDDGAQPSTWDECAWKPEKTEA